MGVGVHLLDRPGAVTTSKWPQKARPLKHGSELQECCIAADACEVCQGFTHPTHLERMVRVKVGVVGGRGEGGGGDGRVEGEGEGER